MSGYPSAGIIYKPTIAAADKLARVLEQKLPEMGTSAWLCSSWDEQKAKDLVTGTSMLISIGGDGTILKTARAAIPWSIPILGINLGKLGFMTEVSAKDAVDVLPDFLAGKGWLDERAMIQAEINPQKDNPQTYYALNDIAIGRGAKLRVINVSTSINGAHLTSYKADGVIVSTATGCTGYALSCKGPILNPRAKEMVLLPVAAHLTMSTPLVISATSTVELQVQFDHQAILSVDGQDETELTSGDRIKITRSTFTSHFLRMQPENYFYQTLVLKLSTKKEL
ncbi:MAG: NAD(+)/NADH kinase [Chloroflexi bacterium]|nr:NAD(+)/NADH kinase [Chloroflexota bacterium]MBT7081478.1 NAD(+)/NADH kinase [Chloroflexota bacterium]MBT7289759.1 NAD(+)/NADH kinase [Chloroflexota bacterium]